MSLGQKEFEDGGVVSDSYYVVEYCNTSVAIPVLDLHVGSKQIMSAYVLPEQSLSAHAFRRRHSQFEKRRSRKMRSMAQMILDRIQGGKDRPQPPSL